MTPLEADRVIAAITARLTRLTWTPEVWADFREAMIRVKIDGEQGVAAVKNLLLGMKVAPTPAHFLEAFRAAQPVKAGPTTAAPTTGERGEFFAPGALRIVAGWQWAWQSPAWPIIIDSLPLFERTHGWAVPWEELIDSLKAQGLVSRLSNEQVKDLGLWLYDLKPKARTLEREGVGKWERDQQAKAAWKSKALADLRKRAKGVKA
jgi:hypothetical protein